MINAIDPAKDVDGFHVTNVGLLGTGQNAMVPCTPLGCLMMLRGHLGDLSGLEAVVVGRSNIVGKPMAQLLLGDNCTVTIAHSRTRDLASICRRADILVAAVGRPEMIPGDWVRRDGNRCGHQSDRTGRQATLGRRRGFQQRGRDCGHHNASAGRCRSHDHRQSAR